MCLETSAPLPDISVMKFLLATSVLVVLVPCIAIAEVPMPFRSNAELFGAERIVLCSDFEQINSSSVTQFLASLDQRFTEVEVLDGPESVEKAISFNALVVISGQETTRPTLECASKTVPYGADVLQEVRSSVEKLEQGFEHPNPTINDALGDTQWIGSNFYHTTENWVTIVIAIREPSVYQLNHTMISLFDLPNTVCEQNLACLSR